MDAGQRAAEVEGKGQKESGVRMFYTGWSGFNRASGLGTIAAVCLAELATDAV
ncbi:peptide transporter periplasmic-binding protein [Escherichia coli]|uniref:Peptide transporter periplasmic-binding protein n=1 Tax=Escherichia coli TaxID=562 RepID=A0A2X1N8Y6_ECOLX|nr:peptide transporter periplasmic-binding protein [Escherichia coli]